MLFHYNNGYTIEPQMLRSTYMPCPVFPNLQNAALVIAVWTTLRMRTIPRLLACREARCHTTVDCCWTPGPNIHVACRGTYFTSSDLAPFLRSTSQHCCCSCLFQSRHKSFLVYYVTLFFCSMNVWQWCNLVVVGVLVIAVLEALVGFYKPTLGTLSTG
jgi:hypothetical protein